MANNPDPVYWDSCTYIDFLRGNHENRDHMLRVMRDWEDGETILVTSALTIAEVLYVKCQGQLLTIGKEDEQKLIDFFNPPPERGFKLVEVSRAIAEGARELVWNHGIKPKDAIHVASAIHSGCEMLHAHDRDLWRKSRTVGGDPLLQIGPPQWQRQADMFDDLDKESGSP